MEKGTGLDAILVYHDGVTLIPGHSVAFLVGCSFLCLDSPLVIIT
jgi:hypothetical protein